VRRTFAVSTLERWYYDYRKGGIDGLRPARRRDRGAAQGLTQEQRQLLVAIRREHPRASVPLILRTLQADGRLQAGIVGEATVRRLFLEHGVDRTTLRREGKTGRVRRRWEAAAPGVLWHSDVCHGPALKVQGHSVPLRIHALLDDASRYILAIQACDNEQEVEMLKLVVRALRLHPAPTTLYLDNGSTYSGEALSTACGRLNINLLHARPYDPQARGKMERFWRTLREGCLDHLGEQASLHDVQVRMRAFIDEHYHRAPHASLMGRSPSQVWQQAQKAGQLLDDDALSNALTVRVKRRVRGDGTLSIGGVDWEADQGYVAGSVATIARNLLDLSAAPWVEYEGKRLALRPVDAVRNGKAHRGKPHRAARGIDVPFDPAGALLRKAVGRVVVQEDSP
jgi:transposase InsO family protein